MVRDSRGVGLFEFRGGYMPDEEYPPEQIPTDIFDLPPLNELPVSPLRLTRTRKLSLRG